MEDGDPPKKDQGKSHEYEVRNVICSKKDGFCTVGNVWRALRLNPAPGASGTTPVTTGSTTEVYGLGQVTHQVDEEHHTVTNTTTPQHLLHPGQVRHEVRETGERIEVVTTGTGAGALGRINEALSGTVWWLSMQNVKREVSKTPKDSTED